MENEGGRYGGREFREAREAMKEGGREGRRG
jgi:hypothetical protein